MKKMKTIGLKMTNYFKCFCLSACFISISVNHLSALPISAQHEKLSINMQDKTLEDVFTFIENHSDYVFIYHASKIDLSHKVNVNIKDQPIKDILKDVFRGTGLTYVVKGRQIVVKKEDAPQTPGVKSVAVLQQQKGITVSGNIKDDTGFPLIGVNVVIKGSNQGVITDVDGNFSMEDVPSSAILRFSYIGYQPIEMKAQESIMLVMHEDNEKLEEVVVVGYGTQKKVNLTGAIEVVDGDRLKNRPSTNVSQVMQGTVSGVNFSYGNSGSEPGAKLNLQIRGQGEPYVLIDGTVGDLNMIDPNDIENISVLKDAAASAIYGARAPYGVVIITTKSGKREEKIQVDFSANVAFTKPIRKPRMVDSYTFVRAMNEFHDNQGESRLFAEETIDRIIAYINNPSLPETVPDATNSNQWATYLLANGNNDWIDVHFGSGVRNQENVSIKGGGKDLAFYLSAGHAYEKGILNFGKDTYRRINFNAKLDLSLTKWWKLSSNTRVVQSTRENPNYDDEGDYDMMIHQIFRTQPNQFLKSPNGYYSRLSRIPMIEAGSDKTITRGILQRFATDITPLKNWTISADYSIDFPYTSFTSNNLTAYEDLVDGSLSAIPTTVPSYVNKYKSHTMYNSLNVYTSYKFDLKDKHHFTAMLGFQQESNSYDYLSGLKKELITPEVPSISTATGEMQTTDDLTHWSTQGYFARLNYDYMGKYLLEVNARYDGTSKFTKDHRWGLFPSFSLGWNISHEKFWEPVSPYVNTLKLRTSWGSLGNQNVDAYQDLPLLGTEMNLEWILNGKRPAYTTAPNLINPVLTWESSKTVDVGADLGFFNNRLQITADYYQRLTFNRLGPAQALPAVLGADIPKENNSELRTRGWDLSFTWRDKVSNDFSYSVTAMLFDYKSVVTKYNNPTGILTTDYEGKTIGEIWGYETVGLIRTQEDADRINQSKSQNFINAQVWRTGDVMYRDLNNDGLINNGKNTVSDHGDLRIIGNNTPRYQFGITLSADYKGFDFMAFFQGTAKRDLWLTGNMFWGFNNWNQTTLFPHHLDYYRDAEESTYSGLGVNTDAYYPRPYSQSSLYKKNQQIQTRYLQNGAYLRLKNLQLGYSIPQTVLKKVGLQKSRIYCSAENVLTLTKLPVGFDPETANLGKYGNGKSMFSLAVLSFGLNVSF
ncbi:SusC/RagA family TonB-linked outer membrane protein [Parabacteroides sp. AM58-2XD]|uniref:TonB-dependent receptor n=1 Tax=Parabacteroides TaxID=375288 RepID=UPI000F00D723|nr:MULTISPECIES: TonB-dependent receptor [Parabacteroides]RGY95471.1 SusC/RagA family TonB-linked outer membrane protein [Parabacteroides sp. AM58-2XD]RKU64114.1 SusC/RagA family TonB-linked outer membrane protein [Parabacteroides sp. AF17-3]GKG75684.1 SusC/RagA family TonB-linked outer membrane protein [Parabacteroides goldsteinii]GKG80908.1 SusC/RagA family TonB-linked outer membrane protein [Parabacteroides goldsteinii]